MPYCGIARREFSRYRVVLDCERAAIATAEAFVGDQLAERMELVTLDRRSPARAGPADSRYLHERPGAGPEPADT